MAERYLVPFDGSGPSRAALDFAIERFPEADLEAIYVVPLPEGYWAAFAGFEEDSPDVDHPILNRAREAGEEILAEARALAEERGRELDTDLRMGKPTRTIVSVAEDEGVDGIVIGSHGREGLDRIVLGSVAEAVVKRSPVPVIVVR